jgi:hypothetical protein
MNPAATDPQPDTTQRPMGDGAAMTQVTRDHDDWLQSEFDMLTRACLRLKTHPTLSVLQSLDQVSGAHTGMLLHYADQLESLLDSIGKHAGTLQRMAQGARR